MPEVLSRARGSGRVQSARTSRQPTPVQVSVGVRGTVQQRGEIGVR
jgi:hypothetical protein